MWEVVEPGKYGLVSPLQGGDVGPGRPRVVMYTERRLSGDHLKARDLLKALIPTILIFIKSAHVPTFKLNVMELFRTWSKFPKILFD